MNIIDVVATVFLLGAVVAGFRRGLVATLGTLIGASVGVAAAWFAIPHISAWVSSPGWRICAILTAIVVLPISGAQLGGIVGHLARRGVDATALRLTDRVFGAGANGIVCALALSLAGAIITSSGTPSLALLVAESRVISTIDRAIPTPVARALAQLRQTSIPAGIAALGDVFDVVEPATIPSVEADDPDIERAARAVARISGVAFACGSSSTGSGFAFSYHYVMTNAHVVAGVSQPVVEFPQQQATSGEVVYFNARKDIAVIEIDDEAPVTVSVTRNQQVGDTAVVIGYPYGGPIQLSGAEILQVGAADIPDVSGTTTSSRHIYALAARVQPGNSGGPLVTARGGVSGMVFAKSADSDSLGYAMTVDELSGVISKAATFTEPVDTGSCISD